MAIQIHECHTFSLRKLLLGNMYNTIGTECQTMKTLAEGKSLNLAGPWWLFQLWLVATFEKKLQFHIPPVHNEEINKQRIEGVRLAYLTRRLNNCSIVEIFSEYFDIFSGCDTFEPTMTPFIDQKLGPKWFQREFSTEDSKFLKDNIKCGRNI
jgi:hypothetical protein